jgi:hypothetical protein
VPGFGVGAQEGAADLVCREPQQVESVLGGPVDSNVGHGFSCGSGNLTKPYLI